MITRQLTVNVYEVGEVLDFSEVMPKHNKSALENAKKALVISARRLMSGAYSYIVVTDKANTVQVSEEEIQAATMIDKVDLSALFDGDEEETEADDDGPRCEETPQSVKEKQREYYRNYYKRNSERIRENQRRYWERKAQNANA